MSKILLVDDDQIFRETLRKSLVSAGHEVTLAENGKIADKLLQQNSNFALLITDVRMPEMDGIELTSVVRSRSKIPIIMVTGFSEILDTRDAYQLGANEFLPKPFKLQELQEAVGRCLNISAAPAGLEDSSNFCKLGIDDFANGRKITFNIFARLDGDRFIKVAQQGEDISHDRIRFYREKGLNFLYLKKEDFRKYVDFGQQTPVKTPLDAAAAAKKLELFRQIDEILNRQIRHEGADPVLFESAAAFIEASLNVLGDDPQIIDMLCKLRDHADHLLPHSLGVGLYSLMIAQKINWNMPTNRFKVAVGALLHDIGHIESPREVLGQPRNQWSPGQLQRYETHSSNGVNFLKMLKGIPDDVTEIVRHHHENCLGTGFPGKVKKSAIHPMAKLIAVADEFCHRIIKNPNSESLAPADALRAMSYHRGPELDKSYLDALIHLFLKSSQQSAS